MRLIIHIFGTNHLFTTVITAQEYL